MTDLTALRAELDAGHPDTGAYSLDDSVAADEISVVNRTRNLSTLSGDAIFNAADTTEYGALTNANKQLFLSICGRDSVDPFGANNVGAMQSIFGGGSTTISNLTALRTEPVSRADELGLGNVRAGTVTQARAL